MHSIKKQQKVVTRHIWKNVLKRRENIRPQTSMKAFYLKRKEAIEQFFGTAKAYYNLRYTRQIDKARTEDKVELTLAGLNIIAQTEPQNT